MKSRDLLTSLAQSLLAFCHPICRVGGARSTQAFPQCCERGCSGLFQSGTTRAKSTYCTQSAHLRHWAVLETQTLTRNLWLCQAVRYPSQSVRAYVGTTACNHTCMRWRREYSWISSSVALEKAISHVLHRASLLEASSSRYEFGLVASSISRVCESDGTWGRKQ